MSGRDDVQQLGDDRRDAAEMSGPYRPLESERDVADIDDRSRSPAGYIAVDAGREEHVDAGAGELRAVAFEIARIARESSSRSELQRVDEDRNDDRRRCVRARAADELQVAGVQRTHRRNEAERSRQRVARARALRDRGGDSACGESRSYARVTRSTVRPTTNGAPTGSVDVAATTRAVEFRAVAAVEVGEDERAAVDAQAGVPARNVPVEGDAGPATRIVAPDRDLALELPGLAVERAAEHLEQVHRALRFVSRARRSWRGEADGARAAESAPRQACAYVTPPCRYIVERRAAARRTRDRSSSPPTNAPLRHHHRIGVAGHGSRLGTKARVDRHRVLQPAANARSAFAGCRARPPERCRCGARPAAGPPR